jgi:hypothetical protein
MRLARTSINPARAKALMSLALTMGRHPQLSGARTKHRYRAEFFVTLPLRPVFLIDVTAGNDFIFLLFRCIMTVPRHEISARNGIFIRSLQFTNFARTNLVSARSCDSYHDGFSVGCHDAADFNLQTRAAKPGYRR